MKTSFKSTIISFCTIFIIMLTTTKISESCGAGYEPEDYRVSFFSPSVLGDMAFEPFYYTSKIMNSYVSGFESDKIRNLKLWQKELGGSVRLEDIGKTLYDTEFEEVTANGIINTLKNSNNSFASALLESKNKDILNYFTIAKQNEHVNFSYADPWGENDDNGAEERKKMVDKINAMLEFAPTEFLKQRYAYLQLVNYHYLPQHDKGVKLFHKYFDAKNNDIITAWAIFHLAECTSDKLEANYYFSLAFDKCDSKKARTYILFSEKRVLETLPLAKNNHEKATIYTMSAMNNPARKMDVIRKVYDLDKDSPNVNRLVLREINKIEDWLLTPKITGMPKSIYEDGDNFYGGNNEAPQLMRNEISWQTNYFKLKNYEKDLDYARDLRSFLEQILPTATKNKDFLKLAISHLYFIDSNPQMALAYNNKVTGTNTATKAQQEINQILLLPLTENIMDEATKAKLYQSLQWIQNHLSEVNEPFRTVGQLNLYLSRMYYRKGDIMTAAFLNQKTGYTGKNEYVGSNYYNSIAFFDRYATTTDIENGIKLLDKSGKTNFEKYIVNTYTKEEIAFKEANNGWYLGTWGMDDVMGTEVRKAALIDLQGTISFRQDNLKQALKYFEKLPENYWDNNYYFSEYMTLNPFAKNFIWDKAEKVTANKTAIVKRLIALKTYAESTHDASAYFELGNAYYNFTYDGNSWMMFSYGNYMYEYSEYSKTFYDFAFYPNADKYKGVYYNGDLAKKYYQKSVDMGKDREVQAKAALMLAHCESNTDHSIRAKKQWGIDYRDTKVVQKLRMSCSYVK